MAYNATRARMVADRQIRRMGGRLCALRREGVADRKVMVAFVDFRPRERAGSNGLIEEADRKAVISALSASGSPITIAPDNEEDQLIVFKPGSTTVDGTPWRFIGRPSVIDPNGTPIMWEAQVRQ